MECIFLYNGGMKQSPPRTEQCNDPPIDTESTKGFMSLFFPKKTYETSELRHLNKQMPIPWTPKPWKMKVLHPKIYQNMGYNSKNKGFWFPWMSSASEPHLSARKNQASLPQRAVHARDVSVGYRGHKHHLILVGFFTPKDPDMSWERDFPCNPIVGILRASHPSVCFTKDFLSNLGPNSEMLHGTGPTLIINLWQM